MPEAAPLNAAELAEYCRRKGLYPEQIAAWRAACQAANANAAEQAREQRHQSKEDKQRIEQLVGPEGRVENCRTHR